MATFAKSTFNASIYASARPTYPKQLFDLIFRYHEEGRLPPHLQGSPKQNGGEKGSSRPTLKPRWDLALDLGCGTGQATTSLSPFKRVVGVDPSSSMVDGAKKHLANLFPQTTPQFEFVQSSAENLSFLEKDSVDLIIGAQSGHWFDWQKQWPEINRVLRRGGTSAFWVYSEFRLPAHPLLTPLITEYAQGTDEKTSLGPHWQRPGRTILERLLVDVPEPRDVLGETGQISNLDRVYFTAPHDSPPTTAPFVTLPTILRTHTTWYGLLSYLRTFSSLHTYQERFPEDKRRALEKGGDGDIAERFWMALREGAAGKEVYEKEGMVGEEEEVDIEWPVALVLAKKV